MRRLLAEQFEPGFFEDPYVNPDRAAYLVGNRAFQMRAEEAQRKSIVLLQNPGGLLPLPTPRADAPVRLYTMGMNPDVVRDAQWGGYTVTSGDPDPGSGKTRPAIAAGTDYAVVRVKVSNQGARPDLFFGGANPDELNFLSFSEMAKAKS